MRRQGLRMQEVEDERENISGNQSVIDSLAPGGFCQSAVRSGVHTCCLARVALQLKKPAAAHHGATGLKLYVDLLQAPVMQRAHISQAVGGGAPHQAASGWMWGGCAANRWQIQTQEVLKCPSHAVCPL